MLQDSSSNLININQDSRRSIARSATPSVVAHSGGHRNYLPYPLYKQKIRSLLKPPDYSRQAPVFMSVREPRSEFERKEASTQVKLLKKSFNTLYQRYDSFEKTITVLRSESIRVNALRSVGENDLDQLKGRIASLQCEEDMMLAKIKDEFHNNLMCKHIRERMRQTLMHLEVKNQYLQGQIRLRDFLIESEHRKKIKTLENKFTGMQTFKQVSKIVSLDLKDRSQDLNLLKEDIESREKIHELRKTRMKKYEEIAETAANEERDAKNNHMRECVLVNILWAKQLEYRLNCEKKKSEHIENAFQRIKAATLIENVQEVLTRFLLKEERFVDVMGTLNKNKERCIVYLRNNDLIESKINELLLAQKNYNDVNAANLKIGVHAVMQKIGSAKEKQRKIRMILDLVKEWGLKRLKIMSQPINLEKRPLKDIFEELHRVIKDKINIPQQTPFLTEL